MMEGFTRTEIDTSGARIVTVHGGKGPPLLLLHGNPFTHLSWHKFAPRLAQEFTVVATDLRGYGDSSKPDGGEDHAAYTFRAMGEDNFDVMSALGFERFAVAGDWEQTGKETLLLQRKDKMPEAPVRPGHNQMDD